MPFDCVFNWSGGKDSALALYRVQNDPAYQVKTLLTTVNKENDRVVMHGVRERLLEQQAISAGIVLRKVQLSPHPDTTEYERQMSSALNSLKQQGITHSIFGDIFLEDLRKYREEKLKAAGFESVFPLWKEDTASLMKEFIGLGFKTIVVCVNEAFLDKSFAGRVVDESFLEDLPPEVDPCGENGEFHTFVYEGPVFKAPVQFRKGEITYKTYPSPQKGGPSRTGFYFCDLIPQ